MNKLVLSLVALGLITTSSAMAADEASLTVKVTPTSVSTGASAGALGVSVSGNFSLSPKDTVKGIFGLVKKTASFAKDVVVDTVKTVL